MIRQIAVGFLLLSLLTSCVPKGSETQIQGEVKADSLKSVQGRVVNRAYEVLNVMKDKDMEKLADYVHPKKGVLFSPYGTIDKKRAQVLMPPLIKDLLAHSRQLEWGVDPAGGEPIRLNSQSYFNHYVYDAEYGETDFVTFDGLHNETNQIQNIEDTFQQAHFVEFFVSGTEEFEGMDWKSLILVFSEYGGEPYLVGIIHDQKIP
ncbi:MAG: hypothetical protein WBV93_08190 [Anaerobacillus sp.]